ncbi:MAG: anthranilate phosphoribosyltransferase [Acidothermaceae bacterium]
MVTTMPDADSTRSWPEFLSALLRNEHLSAADTAWAMHQIMSGEATPAQVAGFAISLRAKGETADEVSGLANTMVEFANPVPPIGEALDIVGSGGDRAHTVNISTMAAVVAAAAGVNIAKHGNRAASSSCGSADLLEELGVAIDLSGEGVAACIEAVGIGFCFAPVFHPAFRFTAAPRRELGVPTVFNFLGPLTNPARPTANAVGVADARMAAVVAGVLAKRGNRALVFRGDDGLDELTTTTTSSVWIVSGGEVTTATFDPAELGLTSATAADLRGADAPYNAKVARALFAGERGPVRDTVLLNAAAGLVAFEGPDPGRLVDQLADAMARGAAAIDDGAAAAKLDVWVAASHAARPQH